MTLTVDDRQPMYVPGQSIDWLEGPCHVRNVLLEYPNKASAYLLEHGREAAVFWWHRAPEWSACVDQTLSDPELPAGLPCILERDPRSGAWILGWGARFESLGTFHRLRWQNLPLTDALEALMGLTLAIQAIHDVNASFHGLKREHLLVDLETGAFHIGAAPRLALTSSDRAEVFWQDIKLIGELLYEHVMRFPYPGHAEIAGMLEAPETLLQHGLLTPGCAQILAGCVSPYGERAYRSCQDVMLGLEQMMREAQSVRRVRVGSRSTAGNYPFRRNNQDACAHLELSTQCSSQTRTFGFYCVADGIGGLKDGEKASALAVRTGCDAFTRAWSYDRATLEREPVSVARGIAKIVSQRLALDGEFNPDGNRGGTTFSSLILVDGRAGVAHVGDSRILLLRDGQVRLLTEDHTLARLRVRLGEQTEAQADEDEVGNRTIARFLSTSHEIESARIDGFAISAQLALGMEEEEAWRHGLALQDGDVFILASDGAHGELTQAEWLGLAEAHDDPQTLAHAAIERVLARMGHDNATVVVVRIGDSL